MPFSQSWIFPNTPPQPPPMPAIPGSGQQSNAVVFDKQHYLDVLQKSYPADYINSIKRKPNGGYELFQAAAAVGARMSLAISRMIEDSLVMFASGGRAATGTVDFFRTDFSAGAITLAPGTIVQASKSGRRFVTLNTIAFGATDTGPFTANIQAVAFGYEYNLPGEVLTAGGETLPGEIDTIWQLNTPTPQVDPNLQVRQLVPTANGRPASLDGIGEDRTIPRFGQEGDDSYRQRIIDMPDTVSPNAIVNGVNRILFGYGLVDCCFREVGTDLFPGIFFDGDDAWDMDGTLRPEDRFKLWLDENHFRGYFTIGLPELDLPDSSFCFDGSDGDASPVINAFDTTGNTANSAYDGSKETQDALYSAIFDSVTQKHMGGVKFDFYLETVGCF